MHNMNQSIKQQLKHRTFYRSGKGDKLSQAYVFCIQRTEQRPSHIVFSTKAIDLSPHRGLSNIPSLLRSQMKGTQEEASRVPDIQSFSSWRRDIKATSENAGDCAERKNTLVQVLCRGQSQVGRGGGGVGELVASCFEGR